MTPGLRVALQSVRPAGGRALLALLGIMVGSAAIAATVSLGQNAAAEARREFQAVGVDIVAAYALPLDPRHPQGFAPDRAEQMPKRIPGVELAAPVAFTSVESTTAAGTNVFGVTAAFQPLTHLGLASGRFISSFDAAATFAVLGARAPAVGSDIRLGDHIYQVIGRTRETVSNPLMPGDLNEVVYVSLDSLKRLTPNYSIGGMIIRLRPGSDQAALAQQIHDFLAPDIARGAVTVSTASQLIAAMQAQSNLYGNILMAMAAIALTVGGIGIMNMMLTNVLERRSEIGLRKAIGASEFDIAAMFLIEALLLCMGGGIIGTGIGFLCSWLYAAAMYGAFHFSLLPIVFGVLLAALAGAAFGFYPALRAARLHPVEALRGD